MTVCVCAYVCTLPYISGLSESIRRVLAPLAIQVTYRPFRTLRQELVYPKEPVPANRRKGVASSVWGNGDVYT